MSENENTQNLDIVDLEKDEVSKNKAKQTDINEVQEVLKTSCKKTTSVKKKETVAGESSTSTTKKRKTLLIRASNDINV
ncbi:hypothetical protein AAZX31_10G089800 [Glycine max]